MMATIRDNASVDKNRVVPLLPLRDIIVFPHMVVPLFVGRDKSIAALEAGKLVICDRFYDASTAYQGYARGIDIDDVDRLNLIATGGKSPDLTIVLDLPVSDGLKRIGRNPDRIEGEAVEFHERVRAGYLDIARRKPERVMVVDGSGSIEQTFIKVRAPVENLLARRKVR